MTTIVDGYRLFSNSEIQTWKQCPRKWWLAYYRELAARRVELTGVRSIGTRGHACLAEYYTVGGVSPLRTHERIAAEDLALALEAGYSDEEISSLYKDFAMERVMLQGYMEWLAETGEDAYLETAGSEVYIEARLDDCDLRGHVKIIGKLDAPVIDTRTGRRAFMDHKFVGSLNVYGLRQNPQMLHYHLLQWLNTPEGAARCDGALYNMLKRSKRTAAAKPPFFKREYIQHNSKELAAYQNQLVGTITQIQQAEEALDGGGDHQRIVPLAFNPSTCSWKCQFKTVCPMFDDGSRVEEAIENRYTREDPLSYYQGKELEITV